MCICLNCSFSTSEQTSVNENVTMANVLTDGTLWKQCRVNNCEIMSPKNDSENLQILIATHTLLLPTYVQLR